ncbi:hypothetical protein Tco_1104650 [Tanacetum coccineum]
MKYLRGTTNVGLVYATDRGNYVDVTGFVDSDYAKDPDKGRSIAGYAFLVQGCVVSWKTTLQHVVALSTTEAEYMALTEAVKEAIWLRGLLEELGVELNTVAVNCDNQGAIHLSRNHVFHERTKHINVRYHFIREVLEAKTVEVLKVGTEHNAADALTKVVPGHKLQHCLELLSWLDDPSAGVSGVFYSCLSVGFGDGGIASPAYFLWKLVVEDGGFVTCIIMEYLVKISKKTCIMELKRRHLKILTLTSYTPYPSRNIRRICAVVPALHKRPRRIQDQYVGLEYGRYGLEYGVLPSSGYGVLDLVSFVVFGECRHRYAVSSFLDTAYGLSEQ